VAGILAEVVLVGIALVLEDLSERIASVRGFQLNGAKAEQESGIGVPGF
jgi:hypothetical protein